MKPLRILPGRRDMYKENVIRNTYLYFGMPKRSIYMRSKRHDIVYPRQIVMYLLCQNQASSHSDIAFTVGGFHRTVVLKSRDVIRDRMKVEAAVQEDINAIKKLIAAHDTNTAS